MLSVDRAAIRDRNVRARLVCNGKQYRQGASYDPIPSNFDLPHQIVDVFLGGFFALFGEMGVATGGNHRVVTEDFLHFEQVYTRLNQVGSVAVTKAMRGNSFFKPICSVTWCNACCTPPRSMCVRAPDAPLSIVDPLVKTEISLV